VHPTGARLLAQRFDEPTHRAHFLAQAIDLATQVGM
jgi:hypothetical protein